MRRLIMEYAGAIVSVMGSLGIFGIIGMFFLGEQGLFGLLLTALAQGGY